VELGLIRIFAMLRIALICGVLKRKATEFLLNIPARRRTHERRNLA